jgi:hypothetical protein
LDRLPSTKPAFRVTRRLTILNAMMKHRTRWSMNEVVCS